MWKSIRRIYTLSYIEIWEECCGFHLEDSQGKVPVVIHRAAMKTRYIVGLV